MEITEKMQRIGEDRLRKQAIRSMLPMGLKESISKVRNTVAFSLAGDLIVT